MISKDIQGYKSVALRYSRDSCPHELFIKEHSTRLQEDNKPIGRTLFVLNIPPYATENTLKIAFSSAGKVVSVTLQPSTNIISEKIDNGFKIAYVVFNKRDALLRALKSKVLNYLSTQEKPLKLGLQEWISEYNNSICNANELQANIDKYMTQFDKSQEQKNKKDKEEVDDEGWTVVTKKGRTPGISRKESVEIKLNKKIKAGAKKKELTNFYRFQIRENKIKNLATLRKNYEEAKKKVSLMKNARRFRPY